MADEFAGIITSAGGSIQKREYWASALPPDQKEPKGHYIMFNMKQIETLKEYERVMGLNEDVLRFDIRIEEVEEGPSIIMQSKNERHHAVHARWP